MPFSIRHLAAIFLLLPLTSSCQADEPLQTPADGQARWKTAYFKRGFIGPFSVAGGGGVNGTIRSRVVIPFDGTQVRVSLGPLREGETGISKMTMARGKEGATLGLIEGNPVPINFAGVPNLTIPANGRNATSDVADASIRAGVWYVQQSYSSERTSSAYNVDNYFYQAGDQHNTEKLSHSSRGGFWPGNVYRIDVLTKDTRPTILCYGDSITMGAGSKANAGNSYPEVLSKLTGLPTLNLGVNSDVITQTGDAPGTIKSLKGVETVIVLMGINDIFRNTIRTTPEYSQVASTLIARVKQDGKKVYIGTILPAGGNELYDKRPAKEILRQEINAWIRNKSKADGVIDFDAALADPANPTKMRAEYQSDWVHPSDAGYQKMAETAATFFKKTP